MDSSESVSQHELSLAWADTFLQAGFRPGAFWTFTFDPWRLPSGRLSTSASASCYERVAMGCFRWWVRHINVRAFGRYYRRYYKHSYFSYLVAIDRHKSGMLHMHAVTDGWIDYGQGRDVWGSRYGYAHVSGIRTDEDVRVCLAHISKYARKGAYEADEIDWWMCRKVVRSIGGLPATSIARADCELRHNPYI